MVLFKTGAERVNANSRRYRERAEIIFQAGRFWRHIIRQREIVLSVRLYHLLAQGVEGGQHVRTGLIAIQRDIIANAVGRVKTVDTPCSQKLLGHNLFQQILCVIEQFLRLGTDGRIVENSRIPAAQLPRMKKRYPIDEWYEAVQRNRLQDTKSRKGRCRNIPGTPCY